MGWNTDGCDTLDMAEQCGKHSRILEIVAKYLDCPIAQVDSAKCWAVLDYMEARQPSNNTVGSDPTDSKGF